jgi:hypothetical protein
MSDNNDAFNALLRQQQGGGSTNPHFTGGTGAISVVAGVAPTDTQIGGGHFQDTGGIPAGTIHGIGSMFTSKQGPGRFRKFLDAGYADIQEKAANTNEALKQAAATLVGAGLVIGGSGAGGIDGPMPTPSVAANDRTNEGGRVA